MERAPCDECERNFEIGHAYCMNCGRPLGTAVNENGSAGSYAYSGGGTVPKKDDPITAVAKNVGFILVAACGAMLFFEVFALFWTAGGIWTGMENYRLGIFILLPSPVVLFYVSGVVAKFYFLFIVAAVIVSFVLLIYNSRDGLKELFNAKSDKLDRTPIYAVITLFAMYFSLNFILVILVTGLGHPPSVPDDPEEEWMLWYSLLNASVWEEVICRVLLIGVPLAAAGIVLKRERPWRQLFGRSEMDEFAVVFIIFSSAVFSYGHLAAWDLFKLIPTFMIGLALGYLFVKYGLYASIMLHFLVNFLMSVVWVFGDAAGEAALSYFLLFIVILGAPFIVLYARRGITYLSGMLRS